VDALQQAQNSCKISHAIVRDKIALCHFLSQKMDLQEMRDSEQHKQSFSGEEVGNMNHYTSRDKDGDDGLDSYMTASAFHNGLESSISFIEKSSKKLLPIYQSLLTKLI